MKLNQFYKRLSDDLYENTHPSVQNIVKDVKVTSLEQVLGIFRSIMIRNHNHIEEALIMKKELKALLDVIGIEEKDL